MTTARSVEKLSHEIARVERARPPYLVDVMDRGQKRIWLALACLWLTGFCLFWGWWLRGSHVVTVWRTLLNSVPLLYVTFTPALYFFFVWQMKKPNPNLPIPPSWRVAMVVTKTPSEPFHVVENTLLGMLAQTYPHDVWLADEDPSPTTIAWCQQHGVKLSTRRGVDAYHRSDWPRRTRSKEGNLAYFYDHYGYEKYDVVVQMDADHRPAPGYLEEMLRPFADDRVGYVSAPSICDANLDASWAVRGRLHAEAGLHGPVQAGHNNGWAPLCIGSHYAVRTAALRQIGGLGPELAEDHSTTLLMNAGGWRGVHAMDAEAHGDGPASFADCMTQEFQWSRSLMVILLTLTPKCLSTLPWRLRFQFLYAQLWYPVMCTIMLAGFVLPLWALLTQTPWMNIIYLHYLVIVSFFTFNTLLATYWIKRHRWLRSKDSRIISWPLVLFQIVRWPWVMLGCGAAVYDAISGRPFAFRVTPKGADDAARPLPMRTLMPYVALSLIAMTVCIVQRNAGAASGYYYFALLSAGFFATALIIIVVRHMLENGSGWTAAWIGRWRVQFGVGLLCFLIFALGLSLRGEQAVSGLLWGYQRAGLGSAALWPICDSDLPGKIGALNDLCRERTQATAPIPAFDTSAMSVNLGLYDPEELFAASDRFAIDHTFISDTMYESGDLAPFLAAAGARNRWPMITVEPWGETLSSYDNLLPSIVDGQYDAVIAELCADLNLAATPVFVRWGHEMENVTGRYPWAQTDGAAYIAAYRHFVDRCREEADEVYYVWSPLGNDGLERYWPGRDYADYVGLSVYHYPAWEEAVIGDLLTFDELFAPRYARVSGYDLPVMIAEFGVIGDEPARTEWLNDALASTPNYPLLRTVVYFNAVDTPGVWGEGVATPDWRLRADLFDPQP